ncbi:MAG: FtsX-like permease family protein [Verrucomicrobia bacterium]|nr:FtsX-like permease family protein [Verrucomicrobiota bacterium]
MKFFPLIWGSLKRRKLRTALTVSSIAAAFLLYGYLSAIRSGIEVGIPIAGQDRLIVRHKISLIQLLPASYLGRIEKIEGVKQAVHSTWFGGIYQDAKNFFPQIPVNPADYLRMYPEFRLPPAQLEAWERKRTGAVVGRKTASKFGFKVGDRVPIQGTIWRTAGGATTWEFDIVGIYEGADPAADETQFFFRYDYFDEARMGARGQVGWYIVRVEDPAQSEAVARKIDEEFANSPAETKAESEKAFMQSFAKQVGDIGLIIKAILSAVFFTILLIAGNTMAQGVRERTGEIGVLKAIGFCNRLAMGLVLAESLLVAAIGGGIGLGLAWVLISMGDPTGGAFPVFYFPISDVVMGAVLVCILGLATGLLPGLSALRLQVATALRRL